MTTTAATLSIRRAARVLGIPTRALREWGKAGIGPLPDARGRYDRKSVTTWAHEMDDELAAGSAVHGRS